MFLYVADVSSLDGELYQKLYGSCSKNRKERINKFKSIEDKKLAIGAEVLLKKALFDLNIDFNEQCIVFGEHGKPYLKDNGVFFNISHSKDIVICAISKNEVGCDIEKIKDIDLNIAKRFFTDSEYAEIMQSDDKQNAFFQIWTHKESYLKAKGTGITESLNSFDHKDFLSAFHDFDNISDYYISVCDLSEKNHFEFKEIDISRL